MNGSGLEETSEEVCSEDTFKHVLSGGAVARATYWSRVFSQSHQHHIKDEGKLNISDLECHYSIAMKNGLSKEQITDISNSDAYINMINAISSYSTETSKEL